MRESDCEGRSFPATTVDYDAVIPSNSGCSKRPGTASALGRARTCGLPMHSSATSRRIGCRTMPCSGAARPRPGCLLSGVAGRVGPSATRPPLPARRDLADQIDQVRFAQFLLFRQGERLKVHARAKGVGLIGDLPFFVSPDSSDVWANPELFLSTNSIGPASSPACLRLFQRPGTALGQSRLQLGRSADRLSLVYRPHCAPCWPT